MKRIAAVLLFMTFLITPAPASAAGTCPGKTYTVQKGDTLWSIAQKCSVSWTALEGINYQIEDLAHLYIGQKIRLEAEAKLPTDNPLDKGTAKTYGGLAPGIQPDGTYIVRDGDSLARIAEIYHASLSDLHSLNPEIGEDNVIFPGQRLVLPPGAANLPGETLLEGFVGVPNLLIIRGNTYTVNITDFPAYADIDVRVTKVGANPTRIYDALTDAVGNAFVDVTIPYTANKDEQWIIQVVTTELAQTREGFSAVMTVVR